MRHPLPISYKGYHFTAFFSRPASGRIVYEEEKILIEVEDLATEVVLRLKDGQVWRKDPVPDLTPPSALTTGFIQSEPEIKLTATSGINFANVDLRIAHWAVVHEAVERGISVEVRYIWPQTGPVQLFDFRKIEMLWEKYRPQLEEAFNVPKRSKDGWQIWLHEPNAACGGKTPYQALANAPDSVCLELEDMIHNFKAKKSH